MNKQIEPFNPFDGHIVALTNEIIEKKPVKNLTVDEVVTTLRLIQLQVELGSHDFHMVYVGYNDRRLEFASQTDRFLAMLIDHDQSDTILTSRYCIDHFGGTRYQWQKIGRTCPVTTVASAIRDEYAGYYGRGWIIAPHIKRLREWIINNTNFAEELKK